MGGRQRERFHRARRDTNTRGERRAPLRSSSRINESGSNQGRSGRIGPSRPAAPRSVRLVSRAFLQLSLAHPVAERREPELAEQSLEAFLGVAKPAIVTDAGE